MGNSYPTLWPKWHESTIEGYALLQSVEDSLSGGEAAPAGVAASWVGTWQPRSALHEEKASCKG
jgi:hypothetical protein